MDLSLAGVCRGCLSKGCHRASVDVASLNYGGDGRMMRGGVRTRSLWSDLELMCYCEVIANLPSVRVRALDDINVKEFITSLVLCIQGTSMDCSIMCSSRYWLVSH
jgi:hypothetical protein